MMYFVENRPAAANRSANIRRSRAFTLTEITLVVGLILSMTAMGLMGTAWFAKMNAAKRAEATLRLIQNARVSWLVDNPTQNFNTVTWGNLGEYLNVKELQDELRELGYEFTEADLRAEKITYGISDENALPIPNFPKRGGQ